MARDSFHAFLLTVGALRTEGQESSMKPKYNQIVSILSNRVLVGEIKTGCKMYVYLFLLLLFFVF